MKRACCRARAVERDADDDLIGAQAERARRLRAGKTIMPAPTPPTDAGPRRARRVRDRGGGERAEQQLRFDREIDHAGALGDHAAERAEHVRHRDQQRLRDERERQDAGDHARSVGPARDPRGGARDREHDHALQHLGQLFRDQIRDRDAAHRQEAEQQRRGRGDPERMQAAEQRRRDPEQADAGAEPLLVCVLLAEDEVGGGEAGERARADHHEA